MNATPSSGAAENAWSESSLSLGLRLGLSLALAGPLSAWAACTAPTQGYVDYKVVAGDTLSGIAQKYLANPQGWDALKKANRIADPRNLTPGSVMRIPSPLLRYLAQTASISHVSGSVEISHEGSDASPAETGRHLVKAGDVVREGALIKVGADASASLQMPDGSVVVLAPGSEVRVLDLCQGSVGQVQVVRMRLTRGRVESNVMPQSRGSRFEVTTPMAMASVRGTRFGVEVAPASAGAGPSRTTTDVVEGQVRVGSGRSGVATGAGQGVVVKTEGQVTEPRALMAAPQVSDGAAYQVRTSLLLPIRPVEGAVRYRFKVALDALMQKVMVDSSQATLPIQVAGLPEGSYHVSVRAEAADGLPGLPVAWAVQLKTTPEPPFLRSPAKDAKASANSVNFLCAENPEAAGYGLQVAADIDFTSPRVDLSRLASCTGQVTDLAPGQWFWRAVTLAKDTKGVVAAGPWSTPIRFEVVPAVSAPKLEAGVGAGDGALRLGLGGLPGQTIELQVALEASFKQVVHAKSYTQPDVSLDLPGGSAYYLRTRAVDQHGFASAYGSAQKISLPLVLKSGFGSVVQDSEGRAIAAP